ncbi:hypothetical protein EAF04_004039 [Stromatinia cepivora]|nr:hypothetical protein EAF04_004039 [Stromatinia cepivora]
MPNLRCDLSDQGEAESPYEYLDGEFFPIETLPYNITDKYRIIAKLGFGGFSTVWLAIGIHNDNLSRWFAIKICRATHDDGDNKLMGDITKLEKKSQKIIPCLDTFRIKSRYNNDDSHLCLVMKVSGPTLGEYVSKEKPSFDKRRHLAIQSTKIIEMHQNSIILEDLSSSNLLIRVSSRDIQRLSETQMLEKIGKCESLPIHTQRSSIKLPRNVPKHIYASKSLSSLVGKELELGVIDVVQHFDAQARTSTYVSPEVLREKPSTIQSNIWGLGCLICENMTLGGLPFDDRHFVPKVQDRYFGKLEFLSQLGLDGRDHEFSPLSTEQAEDLARFLRKIFVIDPALRPTAETILECLNDPNLKGKEPSKNPKHRSDSTVSFSIKPVGSSASKAQSKLYSSAKAPIKTATIRKSSIHRFQVLKMSARATLNAGRRRTLQLQSFHVPKLNTMNTVDLQSPWSLVLDTKS